MSTVALVQESDWSALWERLLDLGRSRAGNLAELCRQADIHYNQVQGVRKKGPKYIGAGNLIRLAQAAGFERRDRDELLWTWICLKAQRQGEGRALVNLMDALTRELSKAGEEGEDVAERVRAMLVDNYIAELQRSPNE